ncbi:unnamed protein product [Brassicogethes aeneus]|uniref:Glycerate kinase n=1 Tax=Brassicogethes aeneus TaxID=1431903 RepID=A0A9P0BA13_BRAAE|nr:unnamed protein product [Brassicogethes aeneus]
MNCILKTITTLSKTANINNQIRTMHNEILREIFQESVNSVQPQTLIKNKVLVHESHLSIDSETHPISKPCYIVGFGKAVVGMAVQLEKALGSKLEMGIVTVPKGIFECFKDNKEVLPAPNSRIRFIEGAENNLPDKNAEQGAKEIKELVEQLQADDFLIVLISGGGSALLPLPIPPVTLDEKLGLIKNLAKRGANIIELNCVRKQISALKGGKLAELSYPCRTVSLILSDIIGDPLDFIASGPTTPNNDTFIDPIKIIKKYSLYSETPNSIKAAFEKKNRSPETVTPILNGKYKHVENYIIGNNKIAAEAARMHAEKLGFQSLVLSTNIEGEVAEIAEAYANLARNTADLIRNSSSEESLRSFRQALKADLHVADDLISGIINMDFSKKMCWVLAGEPTVVVKGAGKGGRNQQLALEFAFRVNSHQIKSANISFLSAGTDGIDGPTDAAGALADAKLLANCLAEKINPADYLDNNDSYSFFSAYKEGECLVKIGHTGTNVMDIHLLIVEPIDKQ